MPEAPPELLPLLPPVDPPFIDPPEVPVPMLPVPAPPPMPVSLLVPVGLAPLLPHGQGQLHIFPPPP